MRTTRPSGGHYLYEFARPPEKRRERLVGPAHRRRARVRPPLCPPGPWSRRSRWSRGRRRPLSTASCAVVSFGRRVSGFCGRAGSPRRDRLTRWSRDRLRRDTGGGAPWPTPGSTSFGSPPRSTPPAVVSRPRHSDRSYVAPIVWAVGAPRLPSWFQARATSRLSNTSKPGGGRPAANATMGIIVGVSSACFRFSLTNRPFHDAQHQPHPPRSTP